LNECLDVISASLVSPESRVVCVGLAMSSALGSDEHCLRAILGHPVSCSAVLLSRSPCSRIRAAALAALASIAALPLGRQWLQEQGLDDTLLQAFRYLVRFRIQSVFQKCDLVFEQLAHAGRDLLDIVIVHHFFMIDCVDIG
jgi:hypothetical protein